MSRFVPQWLANLAAQVYERPPADQPMTHEDALYIAQQGQAAVDQQDPTLSPSRDDLLAASRILGPQMGRDTDTAAGADSATIYDAEYGPGTAAGKAAYIDAASDQAEQLLQNMHEAMTYENTPTTDDDGWTDEYPDSNDSVRLERALDEHLAAHPELRDDPKWAGAYDGLEERLTESIGDNYYDDGPDEGLARAEADLEAVQTRLDAEVSADRADITDYQAELDPWTTGADQRKAEDAQYREQESEAYANMHGNSSDELDGWDTHATEADQQDPPWGDQESADLGKAEAAEMVNGPLPQDHTTVGGVDGSFNTDTGLYERNPDACLAGTFDPHTGNYSREEAAEQAAADVVALAAFAEAVFPNSTERDSANEYDRDEQERRWHDDDQATNERHADEHCA